MGINNLFMIACSGILFLPNVIVIRIYPIDIVSASGTSTTFDSPEGKTSKKLNDFENLEIVHSPPNNKALNARLFRNIHRAESSKLNSERNTQTRQAFNIKKVKRKEFYTTFKQPLDKTFWLKDNFSLNRNILSREKFFNPTLHFDYFSHLNKLLHRNHIEDHKLPKLSNKVSIPNSGKLSLDINNASILENKLFGNQVNQLQESRINSAGSIQSISHNKHSIPHHSRLKNNLHNTTDFSENNFILLNTNKSDLKYKAFKVNSNMDEITTVSALQISEYLVVNGCFNGTCTNNTSQDQFWPSLLDILSKKQFSWFDLLVTVGCTTAFFLLVVNLAFFLQYCCSHTQRRRYSPSASEHCIYGYGTHPVNKKGKLLSCFGCMKNSDSSMNSTDLSTVSGTIEIGTQYDNSDVMIPSFVSEELIGELNDRDSTCTSISDGFTYARDFRTEIREYKVGITEL